MKKENFDMLRRSVEQMVAFEAGSGSPPPKQTTYVGKVLAEVRINGDVAWSLNEAAMGLKASLLKRSINSYKELIHGMIEILNQSDEGFAQLMGVPVGTVRGWKSGRREPRGPSKKLLQIAIESPGAVFHESNADFSFA
ncbi:hypothetical protein JYT20_01155 [Rhodothermus sp. AH-315-K08]|nr:hypothetical protein [Rhodothermus sp. AH-315-K08]